MEEELKAPTLRSMYSVHHLTGVTGLYQPHYDANGEFEFEALTLTMIAGNGHIESVGLFSYVEGSLAQLPITTAD